MKTFLSIVLLLAFGACVWGEYTPEQIAKWKEAAEKGDAWGQAALGFAYQIGKGVPQDDKEAVRWYRKAAEQGHAEAQFNLGYAYANGKGVPEDYKEAVKWWRKSAEQGYAQAQFNLGVLYNYGNGVPESYVQAYAWWNIAAANGNETAKKGKTTVAGLMTKEQIAEAQKLSAEMVKVNPKLIN